jgi:hypothetical protein
MDTKIRKALAEPTSRLPYLVMRAMDCLVTLAEKQTRVSFTSWAWRVRDELPEPQTNVETLQWLWDMLCSNPDVKRVLGGRLVPLDDEWKNLPPIEVAPAKSRFALFFKTPYWFGLDESPRSLADTLGDALVILDAPLLMGPGKGRRLSCHDVACTLVIEPPKLGTRAAEAAAMKMDETDVALRDGKVFVSARSLNHAYTKASLRLEPHRRGPGGRAYDHIALVASGGRRYTSLEKLRCQAEKGARQSLAEGNAPKGQASGRYV